MTSLSQMHPFKVRGRIGRDKNEWKKVSGKQKKMLWSTRKVTKKRNHLSFSHNDHEICAEIKKEGTK